MSDLLLNLSSSNNITKQSSSSKAKGGRWTERVKAKKSTQKQKRVEDVDSRTPNVDKNSHERHRKRLRLDEHGVKGHTGREVEATRTKGPTSQSRSHNTIISSLFTSNPQTDMSHSPPKSHSLPSFPSNAPLNDDSMFSDLGLDPLLVSHLQHRMSILKPTSIQWASIPYMISTDTSISQRDIFIQSQTGSGKTLSFLLPIIQDLLPLSRLSYINRSIGTLAVIIAPTRELAKQISDVLETLLQLRLRSYNQDPNADDSQSPRLTRWLVSGLFTGGSTRSHEKARIRKGLPIIVSTPGRLLDHLQHTSCLDMGRCRWLVLDEADRLLELGFRETIDGILKGLDGRRKLSLQAIQNGTSQDIDDWEWQRERRTVLCSATIKDDVQALAGRALQNPLFITSKQLAPGISNGTEMTDSIAPTRTIPAQLSHKYILVPLKLRLVTLVALLRGMLVQGVTNSASKMIVFFSCTDSVDFHFSLLGEVQMKTQQHDDSSDSEDNDQMTTETKCVDPTVSKSVILPSASIYKLHGSMSTADRKTSLKHFIGQTEPSVLLCTSVASRGLDLPFVEAVIQYDLPTENGYTEYIHRVGRTARAGQRGEAWSFVSPSETAWTDSIKEEHLKNSGRELELQSSTYEEVLQIGFDADRLESQSRATEIQLAFERCIMARAKIAELARIAFFSHVRAYATHPTVEKHIFHVRNLHLGHLAKAFALREAPSEIKRPATLGKGRQRDKNHRVSYRGSKPTSRDFRTQLNRPGKRIHPASEFQIANTRSLLA